MHQAETTFLFVMQCGEIGYHQCQLCLPMNQCCSNCGGKAESLCHMVGERVGHQCQYIWRCTKLKQPFSLSCNVARSVIISVMQCGDIEATMGVQEMAAMGVVLLGTSSVGLRSWYRDSGSL